jgi:hypothetical protein
MDLYVLDDQLRRIDIYDDYISLIWTERFNDVGDLTLKTNNNYRNRQGLTNGTQLALNESRRIMVINSIVNGWDQQGNNVLNITGKSLEQITDDRVAQNTLAGTGTSNTGWAITGAPADVCRTIFTDICVNGQLSSQDIIPFITTGNPFPPDLIAEPTDQITTALTSDTVLSAIKTICQQYDLGFRLVRGLDNSQLYFNIYAGNNRTAAQTDFPAVVFSRAFGSLTGITQLQSQVGYKNCAYVYSQNGATMVYAPSVDPTVAGFDRHVMMVQAQNVDSTLTGTALTAELTAQGLAALAQNAGSNALDGEVPQLTPFHYGIDYQLGDIVEMQDEDGGIEYMRVTEQIFAADNNGDRSYPTLTAEQFITPGSWAIQGGIEWADLDSSETYWADEP